MWISVSSIGTFTFLFLFLFHGFDDRYHNQVPQVLCIDNNVDLFFCRFLVKSYVEGPIDSVTLCSSVLRYQLLTAILMTETAT